MQFDSFISLNSNSYSIKNEKKKKTYKEEQSCVRFNTNAIILF